MFPHDISLAICSQLLKMGCCALVTRTWIEGCCGAE